MKLELEAMRTSGWPNTASSAAMVMWQVRASHEPAPRHHPPDRADDRLGVLPPVELASMLLRSRSLQSP